MHFYAKHSFSCVVNMTLPNHCEYKARVAFLLEKFEAWSKKCGRTYSSKKEDKHFWFLVLEDNYESMNTKKNDLPPKDLVMPDYRHYFGSFLPENFDENSLTDFHPRCTNLLFDAMYMPCHT
jgi:hypothetical protein